MYTTSSMYADVSGGVRTRLEADVDVAAYYMCRLFQKVVTSGKMARHKARRAGPVHRQRFGSTVRMSMHGSLLSGALTPRQSTT